MKIELNKKSWHFKYYSFVINSEAPKSLCPYFWSLVAIILFSPVILSFKLGAKLGDLLSKKKGESKSPFKMTEEELDEYIKKIQKKSKKSEKIGKIVFMMFMWMVTLLLCLGLYDCTQKIGLFATIMNGFTIFGFLSFIFLVINFLIEKNVGLKVRKVFGRVFKIPVAMIKAIYEKSCPLISWS